METEPPKILVYAKSKFGKTLGFIRAFGPHALWITTEHGALNPALNPDLNPWRTSDGKPVMPDSIRVVSETNAYDELLTAIDGPVARAMATKRYKAVIIDTLTEWADRVWLPIAKAKTIKDFGRSYTENLYPKVKTAIRRLMDLGVWVGATAHERSSVEIEGRLTLGGPMLPGRLVEMAPSYFDVVVHGQVQVLNGVKQRVFLCDSLDDTWITGDRYGVCAPIEAADLPTIVKRIASRRKGEPVDIPKPRAVESTI